MLDVDIAISVYQEALLADRAERGKKMDVAVSNFDASISGIVTSVGAAAAELQSTARAMAETCRAITSMSGWAASFSISSK